MENCNFISFSNVKKFVFEFFSNVWMNEWMCLFISLACTIVTRYNLICTKPCIFNECITVIKSMCSHQSCASSILIPRSLVELHLLTVESPTLISDSLQFMSARSFSSRNYVFAWFAIKPLLAINASTFPTKFSSLVEGKSAS